MREFCLCDSSGQRIGDFDDGAEVYVGEIDRGGRGVNVDEDGEECGERDAVSVVSADLIVPLFCCRGPRRKKPSRSLENALSDAAGRGREGLRPGMKIILCGREMML